MNLAMTPPAVLIPGNNRVRIAKERVYLVFTSHVEASQMTESTRVRKQVLFVLVHELLNDVVDIEGLVT